ncbi:MAG: PEP-CTERM sorting domain-containing protein [Sedimentisphaerales bacterium]|nr:PEP-CTERM sorting domain-containing protein [Sedimentisphaerales bacterium]
MKKLVLILLFVGFTAVSQAVLVDDFESYATGSIVSPWVEEAAGVAAIEDDAGNQYLTYGDDSGDWRHVYRPAGVNLETTGSFSFDVQVDGEVGLDHAMGMTNVDAPNWYSNYGPYVRVTDDTAAQAGVVSLDTRDGGGFVDDIATLTVGQTYTILLDIDMSGTGTFDIYVDGGLVYSNAGFRNTDTANALDNVLLMSGTSTEEKAVRIDNINVTPEPMTVALLGLGGLAVFRKRK